MSGPGKKCEWCGEPIVKKSNRVHLPVMWDGPPMIYHVHCYLHVFESAVLAYLATEHADDESPVYDLGKKIRDEVDGVPREAR